LRVIVIVLGVLFTNLIYELNINSFGTNTSFFTNGIKQKNKLNLSIKKILEDFFLEIKPIVVAANHLMVIYQQLAPSIVKQHSNNNNM